MLDRVITDLRRIFPQLLHVVELIAGKSPSYTVTNLSVKGGYLAGGLVDPPDRFADIAFVNTSNGLEYDLPRHIK